MIRTYSRTAFLFAALFSASTSAFAQSNSAKPADAATVKSAPAPSKACPDCLDRRRDPDAQTTRTFYLKYATSQADINEIALSLRSLLPQELVVVVASESAVVIRAIPEDMALAQELIDDLDRPKKSWRLTYTVSEMDGTNRLGTQHYSMVVASGQQTTLKQGDRVPIATSGTVNSAMPGSTQAQFVYQDIGMSFDATLAELHEGARLRTDVMQTSLATEKPAFTAPDPVIRQTGFKGEAVLTPNKPLILGSMDMPGSTHHLQIEVLMEPLP